MEGGGGERGDRRIELFCPSISTTINLVAGDEQKVDLGSIARAFGLDPNTMKLNGYFISRGADLIASSLTWKSLIRFFSARGLPTGAAGSAALIIKGKLSKIGSKRSHDGSREMCDVRDSKRPQHQHCRRIQGLVDSHEYDGLSSKRKWWFEDETSPKRMRIDEMLATTPMKKLR